MARRKVAKRAAKKAAPRKKAAARKKVARKAAQRKPARKAVRKAARKSAPRRAPRPSAPSGGIAAITSRLGVITHTELASTDPHATRAWCERVLGWTFGPAMPTPTGPYLMWRFAHGAGGGIRSNNPPEVPGSIPYCEVADIRETFAAALAAGASEMVPPMGLPEGMGWIAIVAAPGGVPIGFWAEK